MIAFGSFGLPVQVAVPIGAFVMTMLASGILFLFASKRRFNSEMLVLVGIALLFIFQSLLSLGAIYFSAGSLATNSFLAIW